MLIHAKAKKAIAKPPEKTSIIRIRITKVCVVAPVVVVGLGQGPYQILYHFSSFGHILYQISSFKFQPLIFKFQVSATHRSIHRRRHRCNAHHYTPLKCQNVPAPALAHIQAHLQRPMLQYLAWGAPQPY